MCLSVLLISSLSWVGNLSCLIFMLVDFSYRSIFIRVEF